MSVLKGLTVLQVGAGLAAAVCGRIFADVGANVFSYEPAQGAPIAEHLNGGKTIACRENANRRTVAVSQPFAGPSTAAHTSLR